LESATPRFPEDLIPGGRIKVGESVLVPNLHPYETHTGVVVMTPRHYLSMEEITEEIMVDSMEAGLQYLRVIAEKDPANARYTSINWNYMPYAGGSLIHPHLQVIAGKEPGNLDSAVISSAAQYLDKNGTVYWDDLLAAERKGERYLGATGGVEWLATFAPLAMGDVTAVLQGCSTIYDMGRKQLEELAAGFKKVIGYYDAVNMPAFNMALYFAAGQDRGFRCTARMVARYTLFPLVGSDISHMQMLHHDPWTLHVPEVMAEDLRKYF
jgi:galactose-1-phosphate uridylyltransferase